MQTLSVDQLVGQTLGNYRVERLLGKGRLNAVYLAQHITTRREDALTLYLIPRRFSAEAHTRFLMRFRKEAAAVISLRHPHILPVYEYGEQAGYPYLVTPYMMHGSLADQLKKHGRYDHSEILPLLEQLVMGLSYAHSKGFIHGTLRPSNVVLSESGSLLVAGFGLMHMLQLSGIEAQNEQPGTPFAHLLSIAGTFLAAPGYIAPEIVQGQAIDIRSDIYALGCILFELLSGRPPFEGQDALAVARQHVDQNIPPLRTLCPDVPVVVAAVVNQALERDPARRFQSVRELGEAYMQASYGAQGGAARTTTGRVPAVSPRQERTQEAPRDPMGKWQLLPPVVTGKLPSVRADRSSKRTSEPPTLPGVAADSARQAAMTLPPRVPERDEPARIATPRASVPAEDMVTPLKTPPPAPPLLPEEPALPPGVGNSLPGQDASALAQKYAWWSQSEEIRPAAAPVSRERTERPPAPAPEPPAREPLRLPANDAVNWTMEPLLPDDVSVRVRKQRARSRSGDVSRRRVVALLATGGVAVAGALVALNLNKILPGNPASGMQAKNNGNQQQQNQQGQNQQQQNQQGQNQQQGQNKNVIGNKTLALKTSQQFNNPADGKESLLLHLPDDTFVAYERACTHVGVFVNYDPNLNKLVCPAHNAIFDPTNGGAVVSGPATRPLPQVKVQVNNDGTISTV